jgi:hypothetical protein
LTILASALEVGLLKCRDGLCNCTQKQREAEDNADVDRPAKKAKAAPQLNGDAAVNAPAPEAQAVNGEQTEGEKKKKKKKKRAAEEPAVAAAAAQSAPAQAATDGAEDAPKKKKKKAKEEAAAPAAAAPMNGLDGEAGVKKEKKVR